MATYQTVCSLILYLIIHVYLLNRIQKYPLVAQATTHLPLILHFIMFHFLSIQDLLLLAKVLQHLKILTHSLSSSQFLQILIQFLLIASHVLFHFPLNLFVPTIVHCFLLILHHLNFPIYHSVLLLYLTALHHFHFISPIPTSLPRHLLLKSLLTPQARIQVD